MGRLLLRVLRTIAPLENVRLASEYRAYSSQPISEKLLENRAGALKEASAIITDWEQQQWTPDIWFSYHPYYKSPDWIGPQVARRFGCSIITVEASFSAKRANDAWSEWHQQHVDGLRQADCHLYMKQRDRAGLLALPAAEDQLVHLPPFIDIEPFASLPRKPRGTSQATRLITVAMMRADVKLKSYRYLAEALTGMQHLDWTLDIVGGGATRGEVESAFAGPIAERVRWHGEVAPEGVPAFLSAADVFVWPGFGEAYGLAYLEAQACGLPVVAQDCAGVPEVVRAGSTGLLAPENDMDGFRAALSSLIENREKAHEMGLRAQSFVMTERSITQAQQIIRKTLQRLLA